VGLVSLESVTWRLTPVNFENSTKKARCRCDTGLLEVLVRLGRVSLAQGIHGERIRRLFDERPCTGPVGLETRS